MLLEMVSPGVKALTSGSFSSMLLCSWSNPNSYTVPSCYLIFVQFIFTKYFMIYLPVLEVQNTFVSQGTNELAEDETKRSCFMRSPRIIHGRKVCI